MEHPSTPTSAPSPRRGGPAWGKIIGFSCGGCLVAGLLLALGLFWVFRHVTNRTPLPPAQLGYSGDWLGADGTTLSIRADGTGSFRAGSTNVSGGQAKIDEVTRTLEIGLFGIKKVWRIDQPPRQADGVTQMKLNGLVFRRTTGFAPSRSAVPEAWKGAAIGES
jgi:hypothetical protein